MSDSTSAIWALGPENAREEGLGPWLGALLEGERETAVDVKLSKDVVQMAFYGFRADVQARGDFLVSQPFAAGVRDLLLPFRELGLWHSAGRPGQDLQGKGSGATIRPDLSGGNGVNRAHKNREFQLLADKA